MFRRAVFGRVLLVFALLSLGFSAAGADRYAPYELNLTVLPPWGENDWIAGEVYAGSLLCHEEGLCVKLFLRLDGQDAWWPKPTFDRPFAEVRDGVFSLPCVTGGDDARAAQLALMLVREKDAMLTGYEEANAAALCVTLVRRDPDGSMALEHSYRSESPWLEETGMAVGFYTEPGTGPGDPLSEDHIRAVLRSAAPYTDSVRFYSAAGETAKAYPVAREMGFRVAATAWLDGSARDRAELDGLIELCNLGYADTAIVGNETLHAGLLSQEALLEALAYVRAGITRPGIPVTTAETPGELLDRPALRAACDVLCANIHPFWNGLSAEDGARDFSATVEALLALTPGRPLIVSETGWPSGGAEHAGEEEQARYLESVRDAERRYGDSLKVYWFSLADEPWKEAEEGGAGARWGLLNGRLSAKSAVYELYWNWSAPNDPAPSAPPLP